MSTLEEIPQARPVQTAITPLNQEIMPTTSGYPPGPIHAATAEPLGGRSAGSVVHVRTDGFAIASAICGFSAIVPVVSQVIGLALGILSLMRIRRAKQRGAPLGGTGWAITGLCSSGFVLICWIGIFVAMGLVTSSFGNSADSIGAALRIAR